MRLCSSRNTRLREKRKDKPALLVSKFHAVVRVETITQVDADGNTQTLKPPPMADICSTDLKKVVSYLDEAAKLYDALPMQKCKCRAYMITQLTNKLKSKLNDKK